MGTVHVKRLRVSDFSLQTRTGRNRVNRIFTYVLLTVISVSMVLPFLWMLSASLKLDTQVFTMPIQWIPQPVKWSNFTEVWEKAPFGIYYKNTAILTFATVITQLLTASLAGYAFARLQFPERDTLFFIYIGTLMVPYMVIMIPQFQIIRHLGLYDSLGAVYLVRAFTPFGTFLFRQFFLTIPFELSDSARIDGCSEFRIYHSIILPLSKPAIASLTVFFFAFTWNDFLAPLIYLSTDTNKTIQLGLRGFVTLYNQEWALLMAASVIAMLPIMVLYVAAQKYFVRGIATSGLKG